MASRLYERIADGKEISLNADFARDPKKMQQLGIRLPGTKAQIPDLKNIQKLVDEHAALKAEIARLNVEIETLKGGEPADDTAKDKIAKIELMSTEAEIMDALEGETRKTVLTAATARIKQLNK